MASFNTTNNVPENFTFYSPKYLETLPTLCTGQADDLKLDTGTLRYWLSRAEDDIVYVERFDGTRWIKLTSYRETVT